MNRDRRPHRWQNLAPAQRRDGLTIVDANARSDDGQLYNEAGDPELWIYDFIDSWGGDWGVSARDVVEALTAVGNVPSLTVRLNSPGGDYFEGVAIHGALSRHVANVTVHVDALAASAASVIAMAGDRVVMGQGAQMMIHEARTAMWGGTADDFRRTATMLDQTNDDIASFYATRSGGDSEQWRQAVAEETWYTATQAVEAGLADEVAAPARAGAPGAVAAAIAPQAVPPLPGPAPAAAPQPVEPAPVAVVDDPEPPAPDAGTAVPPAALPTAGLNLAELISSAVRRDTA